MFKLAIAAAALAVVGTTTAAVVHHERSTTPTAAVTAAVAPNSTPAPLPPAEPHLPSPVAATAPRAHTASMAAAGEEPPKLIGRETMAHLALERGPARGPADARVTIVVFQDLHCPFCGNVLATIDQLWEEYPGKLRLVVKQFPVHESARLAAEASFAADAQGKFWPMHDLMMAHQDDLTRDALVAYGQQAGLDPAVLADALDHHTYASAVAADVTAGKEIGVDSTPAFLINGREFVGAQSIEAFRTVIDGALSQM